MIDTSGMNVAGEETPPPPMWADEQRQAQSPPPLRGKELLPLHLAPPQSPPALRRKGSLPVPPASDTVWSEAVRRGSVGAPTAPTQPKPARGMSAGSSKGQAKPHSARRGSVGSPASPAHSQGGRGASVSSRSAQLQPQSVRGCSAASPTSPTPPQSTPGSFGSPTSQTPPQSAGRGTVVSSPTAHTQPQSIGRGALPSPTAQAQPHSPALQGVVAEPVAQTLGAPAYIVQPPCEYVERLDFEDSYAEPTVYFNNLPEEFLDSLPIVDQAEASAAAPYPDRFPEGFPRVAAQAEGRPRKPRSRSQSRSSTPQPQPPQQLSPSSRAERDRSRSPAPNTPTSEKKARQPEVISQQNRSSAAVSPKAFPSPVVAQHPEQLLLEFPEAFDPGLRPNAGIGRPSVASSSSWRMSTIRDAFHIEDDGAKIEEKLLAEFVGTFFLVLTVNVAVAGGRPDAAVPIGLMLGVQIFCFGSVSGACLNPAVTLAVLLAGRDKLNGKNCGLYIGTQFLGGIVGALFAFAATHKTFYFDYVDNASGTGWSAFFLELFYTAALCGSVLATATSEDTPNHYFGFAIGCTVMASITACGNLEQGSFNPAVAFGSNLANAMNSGKKGGPSPGCWLLYVFVPLLGSFLAAGIFKMTRGREYQRLEAAAAYRSEPKE